MRFMPLHDTEYRAALRQRRQQIGQQPDTVIGGGRRAPGPDVIKPGPAHQRGADLRNHRNGLAGRRHEQEPGARRALPEQRLETAEIPHLRLAHQQQPGDSRQRHLSLRARRARREFGFVKAACRGDRGQGRVHVVNSSPWPRRPIPDPGPHGASNQAGRQPSICRGFGMSVTS